MKLKFGPITSQSGHSEFIEVNPFNKSTLKNFMIGGALITAGIGYICYTQFLNGAKSYELAEFETMETLGIIK